ncbi:MarR family winged helix-turn-helix transcriptional regulator [Sphingomonas sp. Leaf25]|uniref:MarR family winged helix-turn-helix transcriptional regulator n=1 Tax=Sphingomonas sp. Leaf25 TaxID=1735692 RepID=UPI0006FD171A|nr:MarR family winged helix-turn-helix transcriptional regulator [Sphingomonas sp. Leaf25]KQN00542.1 hypothetical protein ASE78_05505 [Sphingomonas sp. Leaf25]
MRTPAPITPRQTHILDVLARAASHCDPCPTNARIGELIGLDPKKVGEAIKGLRDRKLIVVETVHCARRVTIVATGAQTAALLRPQEIPSAGVAR